MLDWRDLGLSVDVDETVIWMGSEGAGTAAHYDTYGYNVVVQIFGTKEWLLVPPAATEAL